MTLQITIFGLGQIGASIGLALEAHQENLKRIGSDLNNKTAQQAQRIGAVDKAVRNIKAAVKDADIVVFAVPMDQVREMMEAVAPILKEGAIVMDTSPLKVVVAEWAKELLPESCSFVGLTPVLNPEYLHSEVSGLEAATADLFHDGMFAITSLPGAGSQALHTASELVQLMGAAPLFADIYEVDGLMTSTHLLPHMLSAAFLNATLNQPGWQEARKVAGRSFTEVTGPAAHLEDAEALASAAILNKDNVIRTLDNAIAMLQYMRNDIENGEEETLEKRFVYAKGGILQWIQERREGEWLRVEKPEASMHFESGLFGSLFSFGGGLKRPDRK